MSKKASKQTERSFVLVKPDGVQRCIVGEIIKRFEQRGLKIVALKMVKPSLEHLNDHYPKDDKWIERLGHKGFASFKEVGIDPEEAMGTKDKKEAGKMVRQWLMDYMTEAPIVAMIVEGVHSIDIVRKLVGPTYPKDAQVGTIRGDFSVDSAAAANPELRSVKNLIHASETSEEAEHEINHWFSDQEIYEWTRPDHSVMF